MLDILLILLGLAFPNNNANTQTTDNQNTTVTAQNTAPDDTGGQTGQIPPK